MFLAGYLKRPIQVQPMSSQLPESIRCHRREDLTMNQPPSQRYLGIDFIDILSTGTSAARKADFQFTRWDVQPFLYPQVLHINLD
jgi:hypothetical protein